MASGLIWKNTILCFIFIMMSNFGCFVSGGFRTTQISPKPLWNDTHVDSLKKTLLLNYDKFVRPENHDEVTHVRLRLSIFKIDADEKHSTLNVYSWLHLTWSDSKLKWNESDYGGLTVIRVGDHEVWQPDISLYNSVSGRDQLSRTGNRNVLVHSHGEVDWVPSVKLGAFCNFDLHYWPFDEQNCILKFGSWVYSDADFNLTYSGKNAVDMFIDDTWDLNATASLNTKKYSCCEETYSDITYNLTLKRKSSPYYSLIVAPAVVTTFLTLGQFWLPPDAGEKIILNGFTVIILNLFLLYFNHQIVGIASRTPVIVSFYSNSLYLVGFAMIGAVAGFSLSKIQKRRPLPALIKRTLNQAQKLFLFDQYAIKDCETNSNKNIEDSKDHQISENSNEKNLTLFIQQEWIQFLTVLDRMLFLIYGLVFIILAILCV